MTGASMIFVLRAVLAVLGLVGFLVPAILNAGIAVTYWRTRKTASTVPLMGGVSGAVAVLVTPWPISKLWILAPLILDLGTLAVAVALPVHLYRWLKTRSPGP